MRHRWMTSLVVGTTLLALGLALPGVAEAQGSGRTFKLGAKGGWASTKVQGDATTDFDTPITFKSGNGFYVGGVFAMPFHSSAAIQVEAAYAQRNVGANTTLLGIPATGEIRTNYFDLPVLLKLHMARDQGVVPFLLFGPTFSFLASAEQTLELAGVIGGSDIKDELTTVDVGITLALGADLYQSWGALTFELRYTLGLRTLDRDGEDDITMGTFSVLGGVIF